MKRTLSYRELVNMHACDPALAEFTSTFKTKAFFKDIVDRLHKLNRKDWEAWLLSQRPDITEAMLANGADVHACDDAALRDASWWGIIDVVKLLLEYGANVHMCADAALRNASKRGQVYVIKLLLKYGADVHAHNDEAFYCASYSGHKEVAELLRAAMKAQ